MPNIKQQIIDCLSRAPNESLYSLDYDGTLAPIVPRPEHAGPVEGAPEILAALASSGATVAVVTGRDAAELLRISGFAKIPRLRVYGLYGAQRWCDGTTDSEPVPENWQEVQSFLRTIVSPSTGLWVEDKRLSLVVHARGLDGPGAALAEVRPAIEASVEPLGWEVHPGRAVLEIRMSGFDKGRALRHLVEEVSASAVLVAGDDVGDLVAFRAANALRSKRRALWTVGVASDEAPGVAQAADLSVESPNDIVALLADIARLVS